MLNKCVWPKASKNTEGRSDPVIAPVAVISTRSWRANGILTEQEGKEVRGSPATVRVAGGWVGGWRLESLHFPSCADVEKLDKWKGRWKRYSLSPLPSRHLSEGWFCSCWPVAKLLSLLKLTGKPDKYPLLAALPWQLVWHWWCNPRQQCES